MKPTQSSSDPLQDAQWLAHRYDPQQDAFHFRYVPQSDRARATFLTDEYLGIEPNPVPIARARAIQSGVPAAPLRLIFHSAFCLSTLLTRAFDLPGRSLALAEPMIFNDIVGWRHRGADGAKLTAVLADAMRVCARAYRPGETVIVKPSNVANGLADGMMQLCPDARAIALYAPLEDYLSSILKKQIDGRMWVRDLFVKHLREGIVLPVFADEDLLRLTDLQVAAVGWLSQHALFERLARQFPDRIRTLDSRAVAQAPSATLTALFPFFGIAISPAEIETLVAGPTFTRHSKHGQAFDFAARAAEYQIASAPHRDELTKVISWTHAVAATAGVSMQLGGKLL